MDTNIATRAVLITLSISQATFRKLDREASAEVLTNHAAASDAGRFNKQIVEKEALAPMVTLAGAARSYLYKHTLPWSDNGDRVLPSVKYFEVMQQLADYRDAFNVEVDKFCSEYEAHRARAQLRLNSLFNPADYPSTEDVRRKFGMSFTVMPLPTAGDLRCEMTQDQVEELRAEINATVESRVTAMMDTLIMDFAGTVSRLREQLRTGKRLSVSLLDNVHDLLHRMPGLNLTNDERITQMRETAAELFAGESMEGITNDKEARESLANKCDSVLDQMRGVFASSGL